MTPEKVQPDSRYTLTKFHSYPQTPYNYYASYTLSILLLFNISKKGVAPSIANRITTGHKLEMKNKNNICVA